MNCKMNFNQDEFLAHFFRKNERVDVKANELQDFIRNSKERERELSRLKMLNTHLSQKIKLQEEKIAELTLESECFYSLDLTA